MSSRFRFLVRSCWGKFAADVARLDIQILIRPAVPLPLRQNDFGGLLPLPPVILPPPLHPWWLHAHVD